MTRTITRDELKAALGTATAPTLIEALPARYYVDAHLPGAINIPHDAIDEGIKQILPDLDAPIVVYCASGPCKNSGIAQMALTKLGYSNVRDYHEGKNGWREAGLPLQGQGTLEQTA
ncbi:MULTISPECIES: rhodanese-like domain-containing protein [Thalassospira]|uniref:Sulfurtransferase n=2 Tax=Thalassospira tepidiphila TaxID=393657 RepID=A0A853KVD4_9PROT|nr:MULTISPECIES: rhodanese-like domain-containing protein [Thalassospira]MBO6579056.1 rhodanese-like domain-containing protein [Thalassospira sp.]MBO6802848.1 rhodanese-like domain-containing protein [Thalassospira sp.]MBO6819291.1 rhodanese-like domain-containing protein [Thalassospira sp.]MBO6888746.1 rhodanese-like domain-containing protein [Thalassospira sp.]NJB76702.1 rhodanese-related sulfurtransferase [Thalassospira tepidiphila]